MVVIAYKCACMPVEASITVRYRRTDEDVTEWMEMVQAALGVDHQLRSPLCMRTAVEYAKIPAPENAPFIGGKPELHS